MAATATHSFALYRATIKRKDNDRTLKKSYYFRKRHVANPDCFFKKMGDTEKVTSFLPRRLSDLPKFNETRIYTCMSDDAFVVNTLKQSVGKALFWPTSEMGLGAHSSTWGSAHAHTCIQSYRSLDHPKGHLTHYKRSSHSHFRICICSVVLWAGLLPIHRKRGRTEKATPSPRLLAACSKGSPTRRSINSCTS